MVLVLICVLVGTTGGVALGAVVAVKACVGTAVLAGVSEGVAVISTCGAGLAAPASNPRNKPGFTIHNAAPKKTKMSSITITTVTTERNGCCWSRVRLQSYKSGY